MTVFQRAAALATIALAAAGLTLSASGHAAETVVPAVVAAAPSAITVNNTPPAIPVPALATSAVTFNATPLPAAVSASLTSFGSLSAAVAAHQVVSTADEQLHCLAGAIYFESKGEPLQGQLGVAEVIMNRVKSGRFRDDVCSVVTQRGQFSFVRGGRIPAIDKGRAAYRTALAVARVALADAWDSAASDALYFNTRRPPAPGLRRVASIGNHIFYR